MEIKLILEKIERCSLLSSMNCHYARQSIFVICVGCRMHVPRTQCVFSCLNQVHPTFFFFCLFFFFFIFGGHQISDQISLGLFINSDVVMFSKTIFRLYRNQLRRL